MTSADKDGDRNLSVAGFLEHHKDTVVSVGILMMNDAEYQAAIDRAATLWPHASEPQIYDNAMRLLRAGPMPAAAQYVTSTVPPATERIIDALAARDKED